METKLLYEASFKFDSYLLFLPLSLAFCVLLLVFFIKGFRKKDAAPIAKGSYILGSVAMLVAVAALVFASFEMAKMYDGIVGAYQRGEYQTVEGEVEAFKVTDGQSEFFIVDDVAFAYDYTSKQYGYHNYGGQENLITESTRRVRIGYVEYSRLGPVIVRIEELPED